MAAGLATLDLCAGSGFYDRLDRLSLALADGLGGAARDAGLSVHTGSLGGMLGMSFTTGPVRCFADIKAGDHAAFGRFFHAMLDRGVWLPPSHYEAMFVSAAHDDGHVQTVIAAAREALREIA
jgi:glutamate-1-semialdehyde 2,1-aminomutase